MFFEHRRLRVKALSSSDELVAELHRSQTLCQAFSLDGILVVNDQTSADGRWEYAIIRASDGAHIDSFTVDGDDTSWLPAAIDAAVAGSAPTFESVYGFPVLRTDHPEGVCGLCA
jgi:hypothetical protein